MTDLGQYLIEQVQAATGVHPGRRVLHAKGVGAAGAFTSSGAAAGLTTAAHLQAGAVVPVEVRFSNGSADPHAHDGTRDGRGFAVKFRLPDGSSTDIVSLSLPVFFVRTTDDFVEFVKVREPDPATGRPDLDRILAFLGAHPEAQRAAELSVGAPIPASYGGVTFHGVHVFWLVDADGRRQPVRYRFEPVVEVPALDEAAALALDPDYLSERLVHDLAAGPVAFDLVIVLGEPDDPTDDPTAAWPDDRPTVVAGRIELTAPADTEPLIFDPTRVTPGIECSDDPILHARSAAYGASYAHRTSS
ncbi:MAG: catalase family peroxidase [Acidimicrobiales bacterium]